MSGDLWLKVQCEWVGSIYRYFSLSEKNFPVNKGGRSGVGPGGRMHVFLLLDATVIRAAGLVCKLLLICWFSVLFFIPLLQCAQHF